MVELNKFFKNINADKIIVSCILIYLIFSSYRIYKDIGLNAKSDYDLYKTYMNYLNGPLTQEKEEYLNKENLLISEAKNKLTLSASNLFNNNINPEEFENIFIENEIILQKEIVFKEVWNRYSYVYENNENRYFLKGSHKYMLEEKLNSLLYIGIILFVIPFLYIEKENKMIDLIRTSLNGNIKVAKSKYRIIFASTVFFVLLFQMTDFFLFVFQNGFRALFYPMQSLEVFSTSSYSLNILSTFLIVTMLRIIGYMGFSALIIMITEISNYKALLYYLPITTLVLAEVLVKEKSNIYMWPTPFSLMRATGFLMGNVNEERLGYSYVFNEVRIEFLIASLIVTLVMIISSTCIIKKSYRNYRLTERIKNLGCILLVVIIFLTGCSGNNAVTEKQHNFHNQLFAAQNDDYIFYNIKNEIFMKNKKTTEIIPIIKDPFLENTSYNIGPMFANNHSLYYSIVYKEGDDITAKTTNEIIEVLLDSLGEEVLWERRMTQDTYFMDLIFAEGDDSFDSIFNVFVVNRKLYALGEESIVTPNFLNRKKVLIKNLEGEIKGTKGDQCFYLSIDKKIKSYDLKTGKVKLWSSKPVEEFILTGDGFLYSSYDGIGFIDYDGKDMGIITEIKAKSLGYDYKYIYFIKRNTDELYRMDLEGKNVEKIEEKVYFFEVSYNSDDLVIYFSNESGNIEVKDISKK